MKSSEEVKKAAGGKGSFFLRDYLAFSKETVFTFTFNRDLARSYGGGTGRSQVV